ncbi:putative oxidoreductase [Burkholderia pseudomallei]|nr:putative oxidoreductase [Burkholderia pseudomallei]CAJ2983204.1 putative oxidoreductase [Burkholderia pseudomallei]CAJ3079315.1 putative oxidoreductase [Burkholderia pseudomallei]CAJ3088702.1 putative oxidoreductase [Burkholderia pseudomallei]CAJ3118672.1 putative oxidoreductase [Burkholderia pseudomallei]
MHVLVVGAGIAGLAAAWQLKRGGCDVTVVEAAERAGGRIRSAPFHGHVIECGAQFPSSGYRHLMPLFGEAGLDAQLVKTSPWAAFEHRGRLFRVHARRPWTIPASGLLGWRDSVRVSRARAALLARVRALDPNRYAAFAEFDDADAAHWAERAFGRAAVDAIFAPMIHGLYFQPLRGASRALLAAVTGFDGADTLAVAGGWQTLPVALAARLDVRYGTRVDALSAHANGVDACVGDRALRFDAAIVATPATVARRLWRGQTDAQRALLATGYARCAHVAFGLAPGWRAPARLRRVYGALLSPHARRVAALTFERGRGIGDGQGEVVSAMLGHAGASALRYASDNEIARVALDDLRTLLPGVAEAVVATRVQRWDEAEPLSPVGRARARSPHTARASTRARACCSRATTWARRGPTARRRRADGRRAGCSTRAHETIGRSGARAGSPSDWRDAPNRDRLARADADFKRNSGFPIESADEATCADARGSVSGIAAALETVAGPQAARALFGAGVPGASRVAAIACSLSLAWGASAK